MAISDTFKKILGQTTGISTGFGNFNPFMNKEDNQPASPVYTPFRPEPAPQIPQELQQAAQTKPTFNIKNETVPQLNIQEPLSNSRLTNQEFSIPTFSSSGSSKLLSTIEGAMSAPELSQRDNMLAGLSDVISKYGEQADFTAQAQTEAGLPEARQRANVLKERYNSVSKKYDDRLKELRKNPEGKLTGALRQEIADLEAKRDEQLADISVSFSAAQGDIDTALAIVNDQVAAKFEPLKNQIDAYKSYASIYNSDLTDSEKILLQNQISMQENMYESSVQQAQNQASAQAWQQAIQAGTRSWNDVPNELIPYMDPSVQKRFTQEQIDPMVQSFTSIADLITAGGLSGAVGPNWFARVSPTSAFTGEKQNFIAGVEQLVSQETLDTLINLKSQGGTLGALSDQERIMLRNAATRIGGWAVDKNGVVTGYNTTEQAFKNELKNYLDVAGKALLRADGVPTETKKDVLTTQTIINYPKASDQDIADIVNGALPQYISAFNSVGNTTASNITNAIKTVESGGNYSARGKSGEFGAYQFMPNTWKQWAGEFLGNPNAQPTKQNQDFVAQAKVNQLLSQGYTPEQVALIWNAGQPVRRSGINKFGVKYDSGAYADKVLKQLM